MEAYHPTAKKDGEVITETYGGDEGSTVQGAEMYKRCSVWAGERQRDRG